MLTKEKEGGRVKCHKYWPERGFVVSSDSGFQVILHSETEYTDYVAREFKLVNTKVGKGSQ